MTEIPDEVERNGDLLSRTRTVHIRNALRHGHVVREEAEKPGNEVTVPQSSPQRKTANLAAPWLDTRRQGTTNSTDLFLTVTLKCPIRA